MSETKRFNLLSDSWIPVRVRNGETKPIKAYEIAQQDIVAVDAPRADFNAALMQFLIGLLQTVCAPENPKAWRKFLKQPPSEEDLKERFEQIEDAFYLDGDGYRFMQDILSEEIGELRPIEELVFGAPGDSGKEKNQDHFVKRNCVAGLCNSCASSALLAANIFAEDGGRGYFQSMRGNGFVSCLVQMDQRGSDKALWPNLWLNIWLANRKPETNNEFFWLKDLPDRPFWKELQRIESKIEELKRKRQGTTREALKDELYSLTKKSNEYRAKIDSLGNNKIVFPDEGLYHTYWAWMRRYLLDTRNVSEGLCSLCKHHGRLITQFFRTGRGYRYPKEEWQNAHPFSPSVRYVRSQYDKNTVKYKDKMLAVEMSENGLPYTYWQDFVVASEDRAPATVVSEHLKRRFVDQQLIVWAFGYQMDSNSPKGWYESKTPLYLLEDEKQRKELEIEIDRYVRAANRISDIRGGYLPTAIRMAWFGYDYDKEQEKKKDKKPDPFYNKASNAFYDQPIAIARSFWSATESTFYDLIDALHTCINDKTATDEKKVELRLGWHKSIKNEAKKLFNRWAFRSGIQGNPRHIAKAHNQLMDRLNGTALKQDILALPKEVQ